VRAMTEKTEDQKIAGFKTKLEEHETEQAQAKAEIAKKFDAKALSESTRKIHVLVDPDLGEIRYGLLTQAEFAALHLEAIQNDNEKAERVIHAMLQKAQQTLMWEDFQAMPFDVRGALTLVMSQLFSRFLHIQQRIGSTPVPKPKSLAT
jgi:hypothetical protein